MNIWKRRFTYIIKGIIVIGLLIFLVLKINDFFHERAQQEAIEHTKNYLDKNYPDITYEILDVDSSTNFKHYGYFEHAVKVQNTETNEIFDVYYDKKMNRMEDSLKLNQIEQHLTENVAPKVEAYVEQHFGKSRYISVDYFMETGKPMIVVTFNEKDRDITKAEFDAFVTYIKEQIGVEHANVIVKYWMRELTFDVDY